MVGLKLVQLWKIIIGDKIALFIMDFFWFSFVQQRFGVFFVMRKPTLKKSDYIYILE